MGEVLERYKKELLDKKTLEEFYRPSGEDEQEVEEEENGQAKKQKNHGEVLNFEQLINEDDDEEYQEEAEDRGSLAR